MRHQHGKSKKIAMSCEYYSHFPSTYILKLKGDLVFVFWARLGWPVNLMSLLFNHKNTLVHPLLFLSFCSNSLISPLSRSFLSFEYSLSFYFPFTKAVFYPFFPYSSFISIFHHILFLNLNIYYLILRVWFIHQLLEAIKHLFFHKPIWLFYTHCRSTII